MQISDITTIIVYDEKQMESLRGPYVMCRQFAFNMFTVKELEEEFSKWKNTEKFFELVDKEMELYFNNDIEGLREHPFWKGDEAYLLDGYVKLHQDFINKMSKSRYKTSRNTCAANADTCMTLLQRHDVTLYATSRSCDISLGYLADLRTLYLYAKKYGLKQIIWTINTPHIYVNNLEGTIEQFKTKTKNRKLIFNKRK